MSKWKYVHRHEVVHLIYHPNDEHMIKERQFACDIYRCDHNKEIL